MPTLSRLLVAWGDGKTGAFEALAPQVYGELSRLATGYLHSERRGATLETGVLVHEALFRLSQQRSSAWAGRSHFYGIAAMLMRRILWDRARRRAIARRAQQRLPGGTLEVRPPAELTLPSRLCLKEALEELAQAYPDAARVVELRFFWGLREQDVAEKLGVSLPTVKRRWRLARAWLRRYLEPTESP